VSTFSEGLETAVDQPHTCAGSGRHNCAIKQQKGWKKRKKGMNHAIGVRGKVVSVPVREHLGAAVEIAAFQRASHVDDSRT
jgi:hypothetical protein